MCVYVRVCVCVHRSVDAVKPVIVPISVCPKRPEGLGINRCFSLFSRTLPRSLATACVFVCQPVSVCVCVYEDM